MSCANCLSASWSSIPSRQSGAVRRPARRRSRGRNRWRALVTLSWARISVLVPPHLAGRAPAISGFECWTAREISAGGALTWALKSSVRRLVADPAHQLLQRAASTRRRRRVALGTIGSVCWPARPRHACSAPAFSCSWLWRASQRLSPRRQATGVRSMSFTWPGLRRSRMTSGL